ncbi:MAG TPA: NAD-dependent epimerase/dehydratase family protein [Longimicrobiales bacterium]|nr:NAD-dependent epimerase/dehydratase family protein [Longimicrobiales bacterium]
MATPPHRVLLTGATGFVGSHAAQAFVRAGFEVRALVRSLERARPIAELGVELVHGSLDDAPALDAACAGVRTVVHLAALTHARSDREYEEANVSGTRRLLDSALAAGAQRFVYLSSLAAVGPAEGGRPVEPGDQPRPLTRYGRSKLGGERVSMEAAAHIDVRILRAPAVYGPRDTDLYHFFKLARRGVIPVPTGPARLLQMVHVEDLARALVLAAQAPGAAGVYHIAEARQYTWEEVGRAVGEAVGRGVRVARVPGGLIAGLAAVSEAAAGVVGRSSIFNRDKARELLAPGWLCETDAARAVLNFEADIPLADGLRTTAQWYREQGWL